MFGYIQPYKPDLRIREFDIYKSIYCGLCKDMGRVYGRISRFFLSYDFTFLTLLSISMTEESRGFEKSMCSFNFMKKKTCLKSCDDLSYSAAVAIIMIDYKIKDDILDHKSYKSYIYKFLNIFINKASKKVKDNYKFLDDIMCKSMDMQLYCESQKSSSLDFSADSTATAMGLIMEKLSNNISQSKVLNRFGYFLGKWIYLIDAIDDIYSDLEDKNYNPFLIKFDIHDIKKDRDNLFKVFDSAENTLNLIIAQIILSFELLNIIRHKEILDNIIYIGLKNVQKNVIKKRRLVLDVK